MVADPYLPKVGAIAIAGGARLVLTVLALCWVGPCFRWGGAASRCCWPQVAAPSPLATARAAIEGPGGAGGFRQRQQFGGGISPADFPLKQRALALSRCNLRGGGRNSSDGLVHVRLRQLQAQQWHKPKGAGHQRLRSGEVTRLTATGRTRN